MSTRTLLALVAAIALTAVVAPAAAADPPPGQADCVAQFVTDFQNLFPGFTIGDVQGHLGVPIPGYLLPPQDTPWAFIGTDRFEPVKATRS